MTREDLIIKLGSWFILGCLLVFPVGYYKGECEDTYADGPGFSFYISKCKEGYPYHWKFTKYDSRVGYSVTYDVANFYRDGIILSFASPFILEPTRFKKLKSKETVSYHYSSPHWKSARAAKYFITKLMEDYPEETKKTINKTT